MPPANLRVAHLSAKIENYETHIATWPNDPPAPKWCEDLARFKAELDALALAPPAEKPEAATRPKDQETDEDELFWLRELGQGQLRAGTLWADCQTER